MQPAADRAHDPTVESLPQTENTVDISRFAELVNWLFADWEIFANKNQFHRKITWLVKQVIYGCCSDAVLVGVRNSHLAAHTISFLTFNNNNDQNKATKTKTKIKTKTKTIRR